jgi:sugar lactone lactonase YvrE
MPDRIKTELEVLDERFRPCDGDAWTQRLFTGCRWAEGPAYFPAGRYLVFSDIPNDRILRFDELTGMVGEFRAPALLGTARWPGRRAPGCHRAAAREPTGRAAAPRPPCRPGAGLGGSAP